MATHDELLALREELRRLEERTRKASSRARIGLGMLAVALIIPFVYAFVQNTHAKLNAEEALKQHTLAVEAQEAADHSAKEAIRQEAIGLEIMKQLEACRNGKK